MTTTEAAAQAPKAIPEVTPIGRMTLEQIDGALAECERTIKLHSDFVKGRLTGSSAIPTSVLRELSAAHNNRSKLVLRRITLLIESGDAASLELVDKLTKIKISKAPK